MYPYHNRIKQRIRNSELIGHYFGFRKGIGECMVLIFNTEPRERPIRPKKYKEYIELIGVSEFNLLDRLECLDDVVNAIDEKSAFEKGESKEELKKLGELLQDFICKAEAWDIRHETIKSKLEDRKE